MENFPAFINYGKGIAASDKGKGRKIIYSGINYAIFEWPLNRR
jgi:hypothetical protein